MAHPPVPDAVRTLIDSVSWADLRGLTGVRVVGDGDELSPAEAGEILGVSASTVRRYEIRGLLAPSRRLPGSRHRRYKRAEVQELKRKIDEGELDAE